MYTDPCYADWRGIVNRVYGDSFHKKRPTYLGVSLCEEWHTFSCFEQWWEKNQKGAGFSLDKDILGDGRTYSQDSCVFIPKALNNFLCLSGKGRGDYPLGVCKPKGRDFFVSYCYENGKRKHLGCFSTPAEAFLCWKDFKKATVLGMKGYLDTIDPRLFEALLSKVHNLTEKS